MTKSIVLGAAIAAAISTGTAMADASVNAAATSNYIWRGVTQSNDTASVSGGADWSHKSGIYAGTWIASLVDGTEVDFYGGYAASAGGFDYDLGVITYQYPLNTGGNFTEIYATGGIAGFSAGLYYTVDKASGITDPAGNDDDIYITAAYDFTAGPIDTSVYVGSYMFDAPVPPGGTDPDYVHYGIDLTYGEVTVSVQKNDIDGPSGLVNTHGADDTRVVATWSKAWDF